ncbi:hypothetical protein DmGdi_21500 [Gluconobacter sp. Gdi]|nr:hypothetical protein DmGdi_21500 [Gluconobacter sp. Gdi]
MNFSDLTFDHIGIRVTSLNGSIPNLAGSILMSVLLKPAGYTLRVSVLKAKQNCCVILNRNRLSLRKTVSERDMIGISPGPFANRIITSCS